ncbi:MAG TPA: adenylate kinase [Gaiellaceae bacterium]|nr:adenylate kinase [Gaiellaceae bacterium]
MNILLLGPQGAGKGTQAKRIAAEYGLQHIASGDLYRAAIASRSDLGRRVEPILAAGELVPDEITIPLIRSEIEGSEEGFVLDGYPRNLAQAEALDEMLEQIDRPLSIEVLLELDDEVARDRLLKRAELEGRPDDTPEVIGRRLETYHRDTEPVVEHYRVRGNLVQVHGDRPVEEVWAEISEALSAVEARA